MKIYQTTNMESSIRKMYESNKNCIAFNFHWCIRHIRLRLDEIKDIPSRLVRAWDSHADNTILGWQQSGGLMFYQHMRRFDKLPKCEALFFTEMPLTLNEFEKLADRAEKEVIIYRPPDWSMHDEAIEFLFPMGNDYKILFDEIQGMIGKHFHSTARQKMAVTYTGWPEDDCAVFHNGDLKCMTSAKMRHIITSKKQIYKNYSRLDPYRPVVEPNDADLTDIFRLIQAQPDAGSGLRFLRFSKAVGDHVAGFEKGLKALVKSGSIIKYEPIHIFKSGWDKLDYEMIDATATVRRNSGMRMRELLENSPVY